jgi:hypothetical protein
LEKADVGTSLHGLVYPERRNKKRLFSKSRDTKTQAGTQYAQEKEIKNESDSRSAPVVHQPARAGREQTQEQVPAGRDVDPRCGQITAE